MTKTRLLIISDKPRFDHLKKFSYELEKLNFQTQLIYDLDYLEKFRTNIFSKNKDKRNNFLKLLRDFKPDLILFDRFSNLFEILIEEKFPYWILLRGNIWEEQFWAKKTYNKNLKNLISFEKNKRSIERFFEKSDLILPISNYLHEEVTKRFPNKKSLVFYADGRDISDWRPMHGMKLKHPCVGLVQGFEIWGKSKELLTLKKVMKNLPHVHFYLAGDGFYREKIIPELSKFSNFFWLKHNDSEQIKKFFTEIDIFLLLSGLEGLGQTVIESLLMKKPTIASKVGGIPELIINNETGFLVDTGDYSSIINHIEKILADPELGKIMGDSGYKIISNDFSWNFISKKFEKIFINYNKLNS